MGILNLNEVIRQHSPGMISLDAEGIKTDGVAIDAMKRTELYRKLATLIGDDEAAQVAGEVRPGSADQLLPKEEEDR